MRPEHERPPVEHRLLGLDRRKILPSLGILAIVIFWSSVIPAIDEAMTSDEIEAGTVFELASEDARSAVLGVYVHDATGCEVVGLAPTDPRAPEVYIEFAALCDGD